MAHPGLIDACGFNYNPVFLNQVPTLASTELEASLADDEPPHPNSNMAS